VPGSGCRDRIRPSKEFGMSSATASPPPVIEQAADAAAFAAQRDALSDQLIRGVNGAWDLFGVYLGDQLGFYEALAHGGGTTAAELAARTETNERYVREWLELQAVSGILVAENPEADPTERRFALPPGHAEVLANADSLDFLAPLGQMVVGASHPIQALVDAFQSGGGIPFHDYGPDLREGQSRMNRNLFLQQLGKDYLPAVPGLAARLSADPPARIADIGCGLGWSSIGMARAFPKVRVDGFDLDEPSVREGQAIVREAGLADRVTIQLRDAADPALAGGYDLVTAFECIHDMSDPVGALRTMRRLAGENGTVLVMDERVAERFDPAAGDVERLMYGFSVFHCLPVGMADRPSAATGTVMRPDTLRGYAREAGFRDIEILPLENVFFTFYRLRV
jgi:2-polyprenyl-3-methyl-5-hydroxy-6-metoxy-1,4-benzoquinol methylase